MTYISQIIMLCSLNLYSAVCQSYVKKTGKETIVKTKTKTQKFILSQVWRLEVQNQAVLHPKDLGKNLSLPFLVSGSS